MTVKTRKKQHILGLTLICYHTEMDVRTIHTYTRKLKVSKGPPDISRKLWKSKHGGVNLFNSQVRGGKVETKRYSSWKSNWKSESFGWDGDA